jgi:SAM-dependent methyltransferase
MAAAPAEKTKLHLGASNCSIPGWLNTDITPHIWIARIPFAPALLKLTGLMTAERYAQHRAGSFKHLKHVDLTKPLPFPDESVSAVFSSHVLEHLFFDEVDRLIGEIRRVLIPGGVCRVVVPDLEKIMPLYDPADPRAFVIAMHEIGRRADIKHVHHCGFTGESLRRAFQAAGFSQSYVTEYRKGICPDIDRLDNRPEASVFFESIK